mmetsp:Transcript_953/g.3821  ORF Transcript_953/g.3821 Transcript_953/m.3821 type:complete len:281 (-) Transcript_953:46-888(-)
MPMSTEFVKMTTPWLWALLPRWPWVTTKDREVDPSKHLIQAQILGLLLRPPVVTVEHSRHSAHSALRTAEPLRRARLGRRGRHQMPRRLLAHDFRAQLGEGAHAIASDAASGRLPPIGGAEERSHRAVKARRDRGGREAQPLGRLLVERGLRRLEGSRCLESVLVPLLADGRQRSRRRPALRLEVPGLATCRGVEQCLQLLHLDEEASPQIGDTLPQCLGPWASSSELLALGRCRAMRGRRCKADPLLGLPRKVVQLDRHPQAAPHKCTHVHAHGRVWGA